MKINEFKRNFKRKILGDFSTDIAFRYLPIVSIIKNKFGGDNKILEVGSGSLGITPYLNKKIVGLDIYFPSVSPKNLKQVLYKGNDFPFGDGDFDFVFSVDSLEHVIPEKRERYISEMIRVSRKGFLLVAPMGEASYEHDKKLDNYFFKKYSYKDKYLSEHINNGLPSEEQVLEISYRVANKLNKNICLVCCQKNFNLKLRELFMFSKINGNIFLSLFYYMGIVLLPFQRFLNFGKCYRKLYYFEIK